MLRQLALGCLWLLTWGASNVDAAPGDLFLEVMASPAGFTTGPSLGHAFSCIAYDLNSGIKEECYGFYPKEMLAFVGGPGVVLPEFQKNPARFANIKASYKSKITEDNRRAIVSAIDSFNSKRFALTESNCVDLVDQIVRAVGWKAPARTPSQTPLEYVSALSQANP